MSASKLSDPSYKADVDIVDEAIEGLKIINCALQIPSHVPRPRAQTLVTDFTKKIHNQGYTNVFVQLPPSGQLQIEVVALKRDEASLNLIQEALILHFQQAFDTEEETKDNIKPDLKPFSKPKPLPNEP